VCRHQLLTRGNGDNFSFAPARAWRKKLPAESRTLNASLKNELQNKIIIFIKGFRGSAKKKLRQPRNRYKPFVDT
jgi:hypothetical protein